MFAGDWPFPRGFSGPTSIETLPAMAGMEVALPASPSRQIEPDQRHVAANALARTSPTPGRTQELIFFEGSRHAAFALVECQVRFEFRAESQGGRVLDRVSHQFPAGARSKIARVYVLIDRTAFKEIDSTCSRRSIDRRVELPGSPHKRSTKVQGRHSSKTRRRRSRPRCYKGICRRSGSDRDVIRQTGAGMQEKLRPRWCAWGEEADDVESRLFRIMTFWA